MHPEDDNALNTSERIWDLTMNSSSRVRLLSDPDYVQLISFFPTMQCKATAPILPR